MKPSKAIVSALFALALVVVIKLQMTPKTPDVDDTVDVAETPVAKKPTQESSSPELVLPTTPAFEEPEKQGKSAESPELNTAAQAMTRTWRKQECQDLQSIAQSNEDGAVKNWLTRTGGDIHFAAEMPSYFQYDNQTLESMAAQNNAEAMHILGLKLMFEYLTFSMEQKAVIEELSENHIQVEMAQSHPENQQKLTRGRALLQQAVANGRIFAAKTLAESYDLEMASIKAVSGEEPDGKDENSKEAIKYALLYNELLPEPLSDNLVDVEALHKKGEFTEEEYDALLAAAKENIKEIQLRDGYVADEAMVFPAAEYAAMNICNRQ